MQSIERSATSLTLTFRRHWVEKVIAGLLVLMALESVYFVVRVNLRPQQTELLCDRGRNLCSETGHDIFGGTWHWSFAASAMQRSRLVTTRHGDKKWVVDLKGRSAQVFGNATRRGAQQEQYATAAIALQSFIDDPSQQSFKAHYNSIGGPRIAVWVGLELFLLYVLSRFFNGWTTRLTIDRESGEVTVDRWPPLSRRARRTFPIANVLEAGIGQGFVLAVGVTFHTLTFSLFGRDRNVLFRRRILADAKSRAALQADVAAVNDFLRAAPHAA